MNLWNIGDLANRLKNKDVSEKEKLHYLLFSGILITIASSNYGTEADKFPEISAAELITDTLIFVIGLIWLFSINSKIDGKDFLSRYICLGVPISVRLLTILILFYLLCFGLISLLGVWQGSQLNYRIFEYLIGTLWQGAYFLYFGKWFDYFRGPENT